MLVIKMSRTNDGSLYVEDLIISGNLFVYGGTDFFGSVEFLDNPFINFANLNVVNINQNGQLINDEEEFLYNVIFHFGS